MIDSLSSRSLNGVRLLTKSGQLRQRFSVEERIQIHRATQADLKSFMDLFCPRGVPFARTAGGDPRGWRTPRTGSGSFAPTTERDVLRHLQADLLPGQQHVWIAPRSWEKTRFVCIDVDAHGDTDDFKHRCDYLQGILYRLGITEDTWLVSRTPSGGRHYRFILKYRVRCEEIRQLFESVGIHHSPGKFEIFPNTTNGVRLPFGYVPGQETESGAWVTWIRKLQAGEFRQTCWSSVVKRADNIIWRAPTAPPSEPAANSRQTPVRIRTVPNFSATPPSLPAAGICRHIPSDSLERYRSILSSEHQSVQQVRELERLGILEPGTRYQTSKILAWHLVRARHLTPEKATEHLNKWAYRTGNGISKDVTADLKNRTSKVAKQNAALVVWISNLKDDTKQRGRRTSGVTLLFTDEEVRLIADHFIRHPKLQTISRCLEFAFRVLHFAKTNGSCEKYGFKAYLSVDGIIRKWPRCSGATYKPRRDALIQSGLMSIEEKKIQSNNKSGRATGYGIHVAALLNTVPSHSLDDAIQRATSIIEVGVLPEKHLSPKPTIPEFKAETTPEISRDEFFKSESTLIAKLNSPSTKRLMAFEECYRIKNNDSRNFSLRELSQPKQHLLKLELQHQALRLPPLRLTHERKSERCQATLGQSRRLPRSVQSPSRHGESITAQDFPVRSPRAGERGCDSS